MPDDQAEFRRFERAVMICIATNGFWIMMLSGTPNALWSAALSPVM